MRMILAAIALAAAPVAAWAAAQTATGETPSAATRAANAALAASLNFNDTRDLEFATRGFMAAPADPVLRDKTGKVLRNFAEEAQFTGPAPASVNPSLWRNASLQAHYGLFEVAPTIHQIRGFDLSNMTIITGKTGYIIVDPLTTMEAAAAGMALVRAKLGDKPVVAVIYTHSHADHFGGVRGVVNEADVKAGKVAIYAPEHFMEHAVSENVIAGPAMSRRADYMFGNLLERNAMGLTSSGIGAARAGGTVTLIAPTKDITTTGQTETIDGVKFEFQMAPNSEAPAEMNFYLPELKALCMAETANGALHNVLTPRGALVRDSKQWAGYLTEALRRYGGTAEVMFISHYWPRWGNAEIKSFLALHRDAYQYLHDQSVRMMNNGLTGPEIAEAIALPPALAQSWFNRGNYGSYKFNARAVYQRYMGFYDGNPTSLDPLPRVEAGKRYVAAMGGAKKVLTLAKAAHKAGDYRWEATLLSHLVFADPANKPAKDALANAYDQMGYQAEAGPWRNFYLTGAKELRDGIVAKPAASSLEIARNISVDSLLDSMAVRVVPERAQGQPFTVRLDVPDAGGTQLITIENGVMIHEAGAPGDANATVTLPRMALLALIGGVATAPDLVKAGVLKREGDQAVLTRFLGLFEASRIGFPIVTP